MMTTREKYVTLAKAYVEAYRRDNELYAALDKIGWYIEDEADPLNHAAEEILGELDDYLLESLLDFADNGSTEFIVDNQTVTATSVEEIFNIMFGEIKE